MQHFFPFNDKEVSPFSDHPSKFGPVRSTLIQLRNFIIFKCNYCRVFHCPPIIQGRLSGNETGKVNYKIIGLTKPAIDLVTPVVYIKHPEKTGFNKIYITAYLSLL